MTSGHRETRRSKALHSNGRPAPAAIIFDMDGLLVDSERIWHIAEDEVFASRGHVYTDELRAGIIGMRMDEFMERLRAHFRIEEPLDALTAEVNANMLRLIPEMVQPLPGAAELLQLVRQRAWPVAIASSSPRCIIDATLRAQGWEELFRLRCSADEVARGKPAPDVYLQAARLLGVAPRHCLALEDSPNGARAAVAAGMTCYAVPDRSHTQPADLAGITPHIFDDLHAVRARLV